MDRRNIDELLYTDFIDLVKPRNPEFSEYVNRKIRNSSLGYEYYEEGLGLTQETRLKFSKLFLNMICLERDLEQ